MNPHTEFQVDRISLAYLITFRSYGTWLHGRSGSVDRFHNVYGTPTLPPDEARQRYNKRLLAQRPGTLDGKQRAAVELAVRETCRIRNWRLWASIFAQIACIP